MNVITTFWLTQQILGSLGCDPSPLDDLESFLTFEPRESSNVLLLESLLWSAPEALPGFAFDSLPLVCFDLSTVVYIFFWKLQFWLIKWSFVKHRNQMFKLLFIKSTSIKKKKKSQ